MSKNLEAVTWVKKELLRGLPVYLFEVADFFRGHTAFDNARKVMARLESDKVAVKSEIVNACWECSPTFKMVEETYRLAVK